MKWWSVAAAWLVGASGFVACRDDSTAPAVITLIVTPNPIQLLQRDSVLLVVTAHTVSGATVPGVSFTFSSANPAVATISTAGRVRSADQRGTTGITISGGGVTVRVGATVTARIASILVAPNPILLNRRDSVTLHAGAYDVINAPVTGVVFTYNTSDTTKATVNSIGRVQARDSLGTAQITVTGGGASTEVPVTVSTVPDSIILSPADTTVFQGTSIQFSALAFDPLGLPPGPITYQSSNSLVVSVANNGLATAIRGGSARISAHSGGVSESSFVMVIDTNIVARTARSGTPFGAAISPGGEAFITLYFEALVARATLPGQSFDITVPVGFLPNDVAFNSAGSLAYVSNQFSQSISVIDVATNGTLPAISVTGDPLKVFVAPGDSILWVATNRDSVSAIRLATGGLITRINTSGAATGFAARDSLLWVATLAGGRVLEINMKTYGVVRTITLGGVPQDLVLSTNGQELYVANEAGPVQFITLATGVFTSVALPGGGGFGMALRPSNNLLYITSPGSGAIDVVNPVTRTVVRTIFGAGGPRRVAFNTSGSIGIVTNQAGWVDFLK